MEAGTDFNCYHQWGRSQGGQFALAILLLSVFFDLCVKFEASPIALAAKVSSACLNRADPCGMMGGGTINASEIDLEQQGLSGTVFGYSGSAPTTFTLTLPADLFVIQVQ